MTEIQAAFQGAHVLVTGPTGFMGQVLIEKLLRTCHLLERVYLLVRPKKGLSEEERFKNLFDGYLYEPLKNKQPDFQKKLTLIAGDCGKPGLGISDEDRDILKQNVTFVFHVAATVRFDEKLHIASAVNVVGTKELLELSKEMQNLKAFIHISTAYANCPQKDIDEKFYEPGMKWTDFIQLTNSVDEASLNAITPIVIDKWPNTYSYSKCIAEDVVRECGEGLPIAVIRPSIVVATVKEPIKYWINNVYGAAGVAAGAAMGLIRVMRANSNNVVDLVPADMAIHCSIAAAWEVATTKPSTPVIYNYVSSVQQSITFGKYMQYLQDSLRIPATICVWHYFLTLQSDRLLYKLLTILLHTIPAFFADTVAVILRKQPRLMRGYLKIHKFTAVLTFFAIQEWNFKNNNVLSLWDKMSKEDKLLFDFNLKELDWGEFLAFMLRGMRLYTFGINFENLEEAKAHFRKLEIAHKTVIKILQLLLILCIYFFAKFLYTHVIYPCIT